MPPWKGTVVHLQNHRFPCLQCSSTRTSTSTHVSPPAAKHASSTYNAAARDTPHSRAPPRPHAPPVYTHNVSSAWQSGPVGFKKNLCCCCCFLLRKKKTNIPPCARNFGARGKVSWTVSGMKPGAGPGRATQKTALGRLWQLHCLAHTAHRHTTDAV